ncbi:DegT/DnrJ/EryC1/StrS family aminotransferase [bacterium]|nr:DegT/DnrJ/EryC1/StrS family aminotransferase [bacterium]MDB4812333.1 DegT/DnrJ/EryC1/StrS family aminotransferase [Candidatus Pelagibacter sp.]
MKIRFSTFGPHISKIDQQYVSQAMKLKSWYNKPYYFVEKFEKQFSKYCERKFCLLTPNCTSAIHLFLHSLNLKKDDEIIIPETTWIASASPAFQTKAKVKFCDIDENNFCISLNSIKKLVTNKTKVIIAVDVYGNMPDFKNLEIFCRKKKIVLLEDAAEGLGSSINGKRAGSFGHASVFSFHRTKTITTGEGGALLLNDRKLFTRCKMLRDHGRHPWTKDLFNEEFSFKYMPSNLQGALACSQLSKINLLLKLKRNILINYKLGLKKIKNEILMNQDNSKVKNSCWAIIIYFKNLKGKDIKILKDELIKNNFFPRPFFYPLTSLPAYKKIDKNFRRFKIQNPNAYKTYLKGLVLPSSYILNKIQIRKISKIIIKNVLQSKND